VQQKRPDRNPHRVVRFASSSRALCALAAAAVLSIIIPAVPAEEPDMGAGKKKLEVGDPAPAFALVGSDGETYDSSDLLGKRAVVIAWYPKAFTGG